MASQGPNSPSTVVDNDSIGSAIWDFPENAKTNNGLFATASLGPSGVSHYLVATNFGFTIPSGASINGIVVEILRQENDTLDNIFDNAVRIVKGGVIGSSDKSSMTEWNVNETSYVIYGSSTDLWGEGWSAANINASNFGVALSAKSVLGLVLTDAEVDHIRITVYHTGSTTTSTSTSTSSSSSTSTSTSTTTSTSTSTSTTTTSTSTTTTSTSTTTTTSTSTSSSTTTSSSTSTSTTTSTSSSTTTTSTSTSSTSTSTSTTSTSTSTTSTSTSTTTTSTSTTSTSTSTTTTFGFEADFRVTATEQS